MPRFYFNVRNSHGVEDTDGTELPDLKAARREAIRFSGAILEDGADHFDIDEDWRLEVTDETGLILFVATFSFAQSSAVPSSWRKGLEPLETVSIRQSRA